MAKDIELAFSDVKIKVCSFHETVKLSQGWIDDIHFNSFQIAVTKIVFMKKNMDVVSGPQKQYQVLVTDETTTKIMGCGLSSN